jgi:hypothetical protein
LFLKILKPKIFKQKQLVIIYELSFLEKSLSKNEHDKKGDSKRDKQQKYLYTNK